MSANNQAHAGNYDDAFLNLLYQGIVKSGDNGMICLFSFQT